MFRKTQLKLTVVYFVFISLLLLLLNLITFLSVVSWVDGMNQREIKTLQANVISGDDDTDEPARYDKRLIFLYVVRPGLPPEAKFLAPEGSEEYILSKLPAAEEEITRLTLKEGDETKQVFAFAAMKDQHDDDKAVIYAGYDFSASYLVLRQLLLILSGLSIAGALMALIFGYLMAGLAMRPIKKSYQLKQQFLADASHELRTPLSVIRLALDLLAREATAPSLRLIVNDIVEETDNMTQLVDELLLAARNDNDYSLEIEDLVLYEIGQKVSHALDGLAQASDVKIINNIDKEIHAVGDSKRISQAIRILVDNAIKYSNPGGEVILNAGKAASGQYRFWFSVQDAGIGISPEDQRNIFQRFYRADLSRSRQRPGAGLGLSIAAMIAQAHHGEIRVDSALGKGSTFSLMWR